MSDAQTQENTTAPAADTAPIPAEVSTQMESAVATQSAESVPTVSSAAPALTDTAATINAPTSPASPETAAATQATATLPPEETGIKEKLISEQQTPIAQLWALAQSIGHPEIWGVNLADPATHVPTQIILQKYLNANDGDLAKAKDQLQKTLEWRAKTKPLELINKTFSKAKFEGLGYVTTYTEEGSSDPEGKEVFTWNIYGATKSIEKTFGKLDEFLEWRIALMELALKELDIGSATKPITENYDPYKIFQVHDYKSVSFLRQSPQVKSASTKTIEVFAQNYPELLKEKFFVNVPAIMGFIYNFMKLFVAPKTIKKFHPMSNGQNLSREFGASKITSLGEKLPPNYGGKGASLEDQGKGPLLE